MKLMKLQQKLYNAPLLITAEAFDPIAAYLEKRSAGEIEKVSPEMSSDYGSAPLYSQDTSTGILYVDGPLTNKPMGGMAALCGAGSCSYESILMDAQSLIDNGAKTIVMSVDSPGGEAFNMMATGAALRQMADENGVQLVAYVDGLSASAGYGLTAAAHEIVVHPDAEVGSIGVLVRLLNDSKALEQEGYSRSFVYAGDNKIPFDANGDFREEFISDIQSKVNALYDNFTSYVAQMRDMDVQTVKDTQASTFMANQAIQLGLADKVMDNQEFANYLADIVDEREKESMSFQLLKPKQKNANMALDQEGIKQLAALSSEVETLQASLADYTVKFESQGKELAEALAQVADYKAAQEEAVKEAAVKKEQDRKASLEKVAGTAVASSVFEAVKDLDDEKFQAVVDSFKASAATQKDSAMFVEVGVEAKNAVAPTALEAAAAEVQKYQKQKYQSK